MKSEGTGMGLRAMQRELPPWKAEGALASPTIDCFDHAVMHGAKALGKLAGLVDDADHRAAEHDAGDAAGRSSAGEPIVRAAVFASPEEVAKYAADLVVVALKLAQTCPSGSFDLEAAVVARVREKNPPGTFPSAGRGGLTVQEAADRRGGWWACAAAGHPAPARFEVGDLSVCSTCGSGMRWVEGAATERRWSATCLRALNNRILFEVLQWEQAEASLLRRSPVRAEEPRADRRLTPELVEARRKHNADPATRHGGQPATPTPPDAGEGGDQ